METFLHGDDNAHEAISVISVVCSKALSVIEYLIFNLERKSLDFLRRQNSDENDLIAKSKSHNI